MTRRRSVSGDDARAALTLAILLALGLGARWLAAPGRQPPAEPESQVAVRSDSVDLRTAAERAAKLARPLGRGERINVDQATASELERLPRIGPILAVRIVTDRRQRGPFGSLEGLDRVRGIGPKVLEALRPYVTFSGRAVRSGTQ